MQGPGRVCLQVASEGRPQGKGTSWGEVTLGASLVDEGEMLWHFGGVFEISLGDSPAWTALSLGQALTFLDLDP